MPSRRLRSFLGLISRKSPLLTTSLPLYFQFFFLAPMKIRSTAEFSIHTTKCHKPPFPSVSLSTYPSSLYSRLRLPPLLCSRSSQPTHIFYLFSPASIWLLAQLIRVGLRANLRVYARGFYLTRSPKGQY